MTIYSETPEYAEHEATQRLQYWADEIHCLQRPQNIIMLDGQEENYLTYEKHGHIECTHYFYCSFFPKIEKKIIRGNYESETACPFVLPYRKKDLKSFLNVVFKFVSILDIV